PLLSALGAILVVTAALAGMTGTFSPCGFSMVDTLGSAWGGRRRTLLMACVTFALGALAGGMATFTFLAAVGALASTGGREAAALAAGGGARAAARHRVRGASSRGHGGAARGAPRAAPRRRRGAGGLRAGARRGRRPRRHPRRRARHRPERRCGRCGLAGSRSGRL